MNDNKNQIVELLNETSKAHYKYEQDILNGVFDDEWANWYAEYLVHNGLNELLKEPMKEEELTQNLIDWNEQFENSPDHKNWSEFNATKFVVGN